MIRCSALLLTMMALLPCAPDLAAQGTVVQGTTAQGTPPRTDSTRPPGKAALIFGNNHALTLRAPDAWVLDTRSGKAQGLQAVFYPQGERWANSPAVMYSLVVGREGDIKGVGDMIEYDQARFRNSSPTAVVLEGAAIPLRAGRNIPTRQFTGGPKGTLEKVAYIEEGKVIVMIILSCRTPEAFEKSATAFRQLVTSYTFLADDRENILRAVEAAEE